MIDTPFRGQEFDACVVDALAQPGASPSHILALISDRLQSDWGIKLVTVTQRDISDGSFMRLYSSMPDAYAAAGRKPPNETPWTGHVIEEQKTFLANDYNELAAAMYDHEQIKALGCESIVNVPIVVAGAVIGTLNCLAGPGHFDSDAVGACEAMRLPVAAALLLFAQQTSAQGPERFI